MKNVFFYFLFLPAFLFSQEYERAWGTYIGAAGSSFSSSSGNVNLVLGGGNTHMFSQIVTNNSYTVSYYSQFTTTGPAFNMSKFSNFYTSSITPNGSLITASYHDQDEYSNQNSFFDSAGNRYAVTFSQTGLSLAGTPGTWFSAPDNDVNKRMLSKYDALGNLLWKTYLPYGYDMFSFSTDDLGNIYIASDTKKQSGITTSGVLQQNYEIVYGANNSILENSYIAKLNPNGHLIWATYFPAATVYKLNYYAGNLYVLSSDDLNPTGSSLATQGSFQTLKAQTSLTKLNAQNGTRIWGTYYGPTDGVVQLPSGMIANSSGIYLIGDILDFSGNNGSYFGTVGSFQAQSAGNEDVYLSKFDHNGSRLWSTYFGSPGSEFSGFGCNPIDFLGNNLIVTLVQFSNQSTNLATSGSYIDSPPTLSGSNGFYNLMFAKFNENGGREWSSYYGGANVNNTLNPTIGVAVKDINTFYLYGSTLASTGIATQGAIQPTSLPNQRVGFLARFNLKTEMSTAETDLTKDLVLYDNPNNGNFTISGSVFQKFSCEVKIYDTAARMVYQQKLSKNEIQYFGLEKFLSTGNYLVEVRKSNSETLKTVKLIVK